MDNNNLEPDRTWHGGMPVLCRLIPCRTIQRFRDYKAYDPESVKSLMTLPLCPVLLQSHPSQPLNVCLT